ncbi:hypothetical protein [Catenulispora yoronensis]|uniref:hypothetical protein n=1 Tax=Catenulispora yoronensis TaxID=450799 RepID=UPI0031DDF77A
MSVLAIAAAAAVTAVGGCGSTGKNGVATKSTGAIVATAEDAVAAADSVHVQGQFTSGSEHVALDLRLVKDKGAAGTVTIDNEVIELLRIGPDVYVKGDETFYRSVVARFGGGGGDPAAGAAPSSGATGSAAPSTAPSGAATPGKSGSASGKAAGAAPSGSAAAGSASPKAAASTPGDITVSAMQVNFLHIGPADAQYQTFASLTDPRQLVQQIMQGVGGLTKDGQKDIRGTKSIVLSGPKDSRVYVAIDGSPWLLRVLPPGGGTLDFLDYDKPVTLNPPPAAQVVDIAKIAK